MAEKEVQDIMAGIAKLLKTVDPPKGGGKATVPDEPTANVGAFPYWLVLLESMPIPERSMGHQARISRLRIGCHLLFDPATDAKYLWRTRYPWITPVLDAFDGDHTLDGSCVQATVLDVTLEPPLTWNDTQYPTVTFVLEVLPNDDT